jgi:hypothetical protein
MQASSFDRSMYLAYIDESGNTGKGSRTYALGCVLVEAARWPDTFDRVIGFRQDLRRLFGVPVRAEVKANYLLRNGGPFRRLALSERARRTIYRQHLRLVGKLGLRAFAVVVDKATAAARYPGRPPDDVAWEYMLQRLERFSTKGPGGAAHPPTWTMIVHDEGDAAAVRKRVRKSRRAGSAGSMLGSGVLRRPFDRLIDDPVPRNSQQSYFLQLADLTAYASFRRLHAPPARPVQLVPQLMWDELGASIYGAVNMYSGGPPGIVRL